MSNTDEEIRAAVEQRFAQVARSPKQEQKIPVGPASAEKLGYHNTKPETQETRAMPMRLTFFLVGVVLSVRPAGVLADELVQRYGVTADYKTYPQSTPKETLASLVKAVADKHIDYALAHLADPHWVEERVKNLGGKFEELVKECRETKLDPGEVKQLRRFLQDGEWKVEEKTAEVHLKEVPDRSVRFYKVGDRWFMENAYRPEKGK